MAADKDPGFLTYVWGILSFPIAWLWSRQNSNNKDVAEIRSELNEHKLHIADNYLKDREVLDVVDRAVEPIKDGIDRVEAQLQRLIEDRESKR